MMARYLTVGFLVLTMIPNPSAQQAPAHPTPTLLASMPLSDEITMTVTEYSDRCPGIRPQAGTADGPPCIQADLHSLAFRPGVESVDRPSARNTQVWLLRNDGTVVGNLSQPVTAMHAVGGYNTLEVVYAFQPFPPQELAGVVVSVNGKLYVREIKAS